MVLIFDIWNFSNSMKYFVLIPINDHSIIFLINSFEVNSNKIGKSVTKIKINKVNKDACTWFFENKPIDKFARIKNKHSDTIIKMYTGQLEIWTPNSRGK